MPISTEKTTESAWSETTKPTNKPTRVEEIFVEETYKTVGAGRVTTTVRPGSEELEPEEKNTFPKARILLFSMFGLVALILLISTSLCLWRCSRSKLSDDQRLTRRFTVKRFGKDDSFDYADTGEEGTMD